MVPAAALALLCIQSLDSVVLLHGYSVLESIELDLSGGWKQL
jgi:hypothetical protein